MYVRQPRSAGRTSLYVRCINVGFGVQPVTSCLNYKHCYLQTSLVASTLQRVLHLFRHFADESSFAARPPGRPLRKATAYAFAPPMPGADADKSLATPQYSNVGQGGVPSSQCTLLPRRKFGLPCPIAYASSCRVLAVVLMFNSMVHKPGKPFHQATYSCPSWIHRARFPPPRIFCPGWCTVYSP